MADIQQAAKWMQEGKRVRRMSWKNIQYSFWRNDAGQITKPEASTGFKMASFSCADLLADDWEISE